MIAGSLTTVYMYCYMEQSCCYALKCTAYSQLSVQNSYVAAGIGPPFCLCLRWSLRSLIFHLTLSWALVHSLSSFPYCRMSEACFYIFLFCVGNPPFQLIFQNSTYRNNLFSLFFMHRINPGVGNPANTCQTSVRWLPVEAGAREMSILITNFIFTCSFCCLCDKAFLVLFCF